MRDPLNRTTAPQILKLLDVCFKQGVIDAYEYGDDFGAREFVQRHKTAFTFGLLSNSDDFDWQMFRITLYRWARMSHMKSLAETYILFIKSKSHTWALMPFCMQFYLMGIEEWLAYPSPTKLEFFKKNAKRHWDANHPLKVFSTLDYISYLHDIAFAYRKLPEEKKNVSDVALDSFCRALYDFTRKYVPKD